MDFRTTIRPASRRLTLALALALAAAAGPATAAELAPHRAFYSLTLEKARSDHIVDVRGVAVMSLEKACDGWIIGHRLSADLDTVQVVLKQEARFAAWESADGTAYRFAARHETGDNREAFRGRARTGGADGAGTAELAEPAGKTLALPPGTLFPVGHLATLIDRAAAGDRQVSRTLFDGSDGKGPRLAVAFVGPRVEPDAKAATRFGPLVARPGWSVRIAFFPVKSREPVPEYEIQALQLDNGVADHMVLDYADFTLRLELQKIEALPAPVC